MKKKLFAIFMFAVMILGTSVTALAANYPSVEAQDFEIISVIDKDGKAVEICHEIRLKAIEEQNRASVNNMKKNLKDVLGGRYVERLQPIREADIYLYNLTKQMEVDWKDGDYHFPITVTFRVPGVKADSVVRVLHGYDGYNNATEDGEIALAEWHEETRVVVGDGTISVTFEHLSPVVFFVQGTEPGTDIPSKGDDYDALYIVAIAVVVIAGACVLRKKRA